VREQFVLQIVIQNAELVVEIFVEKNGPAHGSRICPESHMESITCRIEMRERPVKPKTPSGMIDLVRHPSTPDRSDPAGQTTRCAIYARVSVSGAHRDEMTSIKVQVDACEAYILSLRGTGWTAVETPYTDEGVSGGTLRRPALRALLEDIRHGGLTWWWCIGSIASAAAFSISATMLPCSMCNRCSSSPWPVDLVGTYPDQAVWRPQGGACLTATP
jgi:Resolvase, N terminal domain